jgi:hypothetical protein
MKSSQVLAVSMQNKTLDISVMFEDDVVDHVKDFISVRHDENLIYYSNKITIHSPV